MKLLTRFVTLIASSPLVSSLSFSSSNFLYDGDNGAYPVVDYKSDEKHPSFLYDKDSGPRIVEFYSPWCPHCVHYKPDYIKLANRVSRRALTPINIYAVSCVAHGEICNNQKVRGYPTVKLFKAGSIDGQIMERGKNGPSPSEILKMLDVKEIGQDVKPKPTIEKIKPDIKPETKRTVEKQKIKEKLNIPQSEDLKTLSKNEIFYDAALSFRFSLTTGIFMEDGPLSHEKAIALKDWITLINRTWPSAEDMNTYRLTKEILENFDTIVKDEANLKNIVRKYYTKDTDWTVSCKKGTSYLGFTCGLWQLFHIMTIGVVEWNKHSLTDDVITSVHASDTLRNFIANFFACSVCQQHFLKMYDSCSFNRCTRLSDDKNTNHEDWKELSLWLWETHNDVNIRLKEEGAEREKRILTDTEKSLARWPIKEECSLCRQDEDEWDNGTVYDFIKNHYWPGQKKDFQKKPVISNVNQISTNLVEKTRSSWSIVGIFSMLLSLSWFRFKTWKKSMSGRHKKV